MGYKMPKSVLLCAVLSITCLSVTFGQQADNYHFNCLRNGQDCLNGGTCNQTVGTCDCVGTFIGYRCQLDSNIVLQCNSPSPCQNGGTCYNDGLADRCLCPADFTGRNCETPRVDYTCSGDQIDITFYPIDFFSGIVYAGLDRDNTTCTFTNTGGGNPYTSTLALDSCDGEMSGDTATGDITYSWMVTIEYLSLVQDPYALQVNVSCFHSANTSRQSSGGIVPPGGRPATAPPVVQDYQPARLELREFPDFENQVGPRVVIRQRVYLFNYLSDTSVFKALKVENCVVSDSVTTITFIENGCAVRSIKSLFFVENEDVTSPVGVRHGFRIFRLRRGSQSLTFTCQVRMCRDVSDTTCQPTDCNPTPVSSRKRRDVSGKNAVGVTVVDDQEQVSSLTIAITDPFEEADKDGRGIYTGDELNTENCAEEPVIKTTLIALGVVSCVLLLAVVVLITCVIRQYSSTGSGKGSRTEEAFTDTSSFHIPRVRTK